MKIVCLNGAEGVKLFQHKNIIGYIHCVKGSEEANNWLQQILYEEIVNNLGDSIGLSLKHAIDSNKCIANNLYGNCLPEASVGIIEFDAKHGVVYTYLLGDACVTFKQKDEVIKLFSNVNLENRLNFVEDGTIHIINTAIRVEELDSCLLSSIHSKTNKIKALQSNSLEEDSLEAEVLINFE